MGKNILIFADGTGNEGGLLPDESRTNVYKLFRATRPGPDTIVDPARQIAFYIPGIGTPAIRHNSQVGSSFRDRSPDVRARSHAQGHQLLRSCYQRLAAGGPHLSVRLQPGSLHRAMRGPRPRSMWDTHEGAREGFAQSR